MVDKALDLGGRFGGGRLTSQNDDVVSPQAVDQVKLLPSSSKIDKRGFVCMIFLLLWEYMIWFYIS